MPTPAGRKRSSRACDGCKLKRMKCEDVAPGASGEPTCKLCRESGVECTFETPVRKRGPAPGFRRRTGGSDSPPKEESDEGTSTPSRGQNNAAGPSRSNGQAVAHPRSAPSKRRRPPLLGLPPALVDELLAVYFTHVHNVWPLIYKPMFNPHTASAPLLLSTLSIAACVASPGKKDGFDPDKLFAMAESALHHCRNESRIDILQALMILSLRQTGCGDKRSAFAYAGRASCMALNLGLHLAPSTQSERAEAELRCRVYWNAYVLDKILAEETGRPALLSYRRASTPIPSVAEADEFEPWPPQTASSAPLPRSVQHVIPRRGYVMSYFVWTCRLAMIVEDILDLDLVGPPVLGAWDQQFSDRLHAQRDPVALADEIAEQLESWRASVPRNLDVDLSGSVSPLPHVIVGWAWYHTAKILVYSRFIKRQPTRSSSPGLAERAHRICSQASEECVVLLAHLDRHKLLAQVSADIIHLLSIITLFEAFDATDPDEELAHRAKLNFAQCCIWLRDFSAFWPIASAHKVFFEGLIQGGLKLTSGELGPSPASATSVDSPMNLPEELRVLGRNLTGVGGDDSRRRSNAEPQEPSPAVPTGPSLFQLPQFYWNHLTTDMTTAQPGAEVPPQEPHAWDWDLDFAQTTPGTGVDSSSNVGGVDPPPPPSNGGSAMTSNAPLPMPEQPWDPGLATQGPADQAAIYSALMSYMVQATKSN